VLETTLEKDKDNKHLLLEEEEVIIITMTREIFSVIVVISLGIIALNIEKSPIKCT
jgi:hypothetical protein